MQRTVNTDTVESRTWSVEEMIEGLQDLYSPLQSYGGICFKYIDSIDDRLKVPFLPDNDRDELLADKAFYQVSLNAIQNGLSVLHDLVDWMQTLPVDDDGTPKLEQ